MPLWALLSCWHTKKWPSWLLLHALILHLHLFITLSSVQCQLLKPKRISFPSPSWELWMKERFQPHFSREVSLEAQQLPSVPQQPLSSWKQFLQHTVCLCGVTDNYNAPVTWKILLNVMAWITERLEVFSSPVYLWCMYNNAAKTVCTGKKKNGPSLNIYKKSQGSFDLSHWYTLFFPPNSCLFPLQ